MATQAELDQEQADRDATTTRVDGRTKAAKKGTDSLPAAEMTKLEQAASRAQQAEDDKKALEQLRAIQNATPVKQAREDAQKKKEEEYKERESRTVQVRATKRGFYPADGHIREPGDVFDYVLHKHEVTGAVETSLPTWMEDVEGNLDTRTQSFVPENAPTYIKIDGTGPDAVVTKGAAPVA